MSARDDAPAAASGGEPESPELRSRRERLKAEQARLTRRIEHARESVEAKRPHSAAIDAAFRAFEADVAAGGGVLAGAVAFRFFLFMVPYVFVVVAGLGLGAEAADTAPSDLARQAGIGGLAAKAMASATELSTNERIVSVTVALFALFLASRALVKVLRIVHALIWRTRAGKPASSTKAALWLIGFITLAVALSAALGKLRHVSFLIGLVATLLVIVVPFFLWLLVSWYLPHGDVPWTALVPGALFFAFGLQVLNLITVYWISREVSSKTDTYGAIGFALALLLWAYLLGRFVTTAAVINESLWARNQEHLAQRRRHLPPVGAPHPHAPPAPRPDATGADASDASAPERWGGG